MKKFKKLNLQLFGEDENPDKTPAQEESAENKNQTTEFNDNPSNPEEGNEGENPAEAEDKAKAEAEAAEKAKEQNRQAYLRRQQEKERQKLEAEKRASYVEGLKRAVNNTNPYTHQPIVDEEDVKELETMQELERLGKDPIDDYASYVKEKARAERKAREAAEKEELANKEKLEKTLNSFIQEHGLEETQRILKDEKFMDFGKDLIDGGAPLETVYKKYIKVQNEIKAQAEELAIQKQARIKSSPGSLNGNGAVDKPIDWANMSKEEFNERLKKIMG